MQLPTNRQSQGKKHVGLLDEWHVIKQPYPDGEDYYSNDGELREEDQEEYVAVSRKPAKELVKLQLAGTRCLHAVCAKQSGARAGRHHQTTAAACSEQRQQPRSHVLSSDQVAHHEFRQELVFTGDKQEATINQLADEQKL